MKFLLKLFCLLSLLSSFGFSENTGRGLSGFRNTSLDFYAGSLPSVNASFLSNNFIKIDNDVFQTTSPTYFGFNYSLGISWSGFRADFKNDYLFFYNPSFQKQYTYCQFDKDDNLGCSDEYEKYVGQGDFRKITFSYLERYFLSKFTTCNAGENFNTSLKQCVPACPAGQSWDTENNLCYVDCSDKDLNKFGYPNGTAQGGCVDCSNALSVDQIMRCACSGFGSTYDPGVLLYDHDSPGFVLGSCKSGRQIYFKQRDDKNPDKDKDKKNDNNSTNSSDKDKDNPKPDKDKDNSNPDKKDNNENSNNSSGESGNSSNNNSGGSAGNGSSGGGGTGVETKPNPNYNGNGKEDGKGEEGKGDDAVAQKLDYVDLKKDSDKFNSNFKDALDSVISQAQDFKNSLNDTISKIKDGGLMKFNQSAIPNTCPLTYNVDFSYFRKDITFDICKVIAPASQTLYYFFYVVFFVLFLIVTIKLFLFIF
ncbi:hypothetical protein [Campylobacter concisus]|uniref:Transmembrane protein n=1 Tax=Campylobacter concisus TaxID=199 RepID=A0A7S9RNF4_9BACT|nr:hypothetical protein [Campylobacter concisus]QPH94821.1 hypothetical protein CVT08_05065 [Campylobacter concisus]